MAISTKVETTIRLKDRANAAGETALRQHHALEVVDACQVVGLVLHRLHRLAVAALGQQRREGELLHSQLLGLGHVLVRHRLVLVVVAVCHRVAT